MGKQLFCGKCGKLNWSEWFATCSCKNPDFKYESHEDYLRNKKVFEVYRDGMLYGTGNISHVQKLMSDFIDEHINIVGEVSFTVKRKERLT